MIEIKNLTKIYKSEEKDDCIAINNLNITLPSSGMVFVVGRSGSGKSTLLNMIGTLDDITSGDIIIDGQYFSKFDNTKFQEYRSSYLGFIFQDFLVLDEFTVRENVELALDISNNNLGDVDNILKNVGLSDYANSFPTELSGGQKQRVAIARALVKNPKLLLCDEPTGNLDAKTSAQILKLLKEESKTKLVLIVSHNLVDAEEYADRIIELADGKILSDRTKNKDFVNNFSLHETHAVLPHHKDLSFNDVKALNEKLENKKIKIVQSRGGFFPTKEDEIDKTINKIELTSSHISRRNSLKLSKFFFRKGRKGVIYTILITALFISLFYIFQVFDRFDGNKTILYNNDTSINVVKLIDETNKGTISTSTILPVTDNDINKYYDAGYSGKVYKLYSKCYTLNKRYLTIHKYTRPSSLMNYNNTGQSYGILCCDKEFLTSIYGVDGKLNVLAGDIDNLNGGIIITDYLADILLAEKRYSKGDYAKCLNLYHLSSTVRSIIKIGAVIETNYEERYKDIYNLAKDAKVSGLESTEYIEKYSEDPNFIKFLEEVQYYLGIGYTFDETIFDSIVTTKTNTIAYLPNINYKSSDYSGHYDGFLSFLLNKTLKDDEILMSISEYNSLFNTHYNETTAETSFKPHKVTFTKYANDEVGGEIVFEKEYTIKGLRSYSYVNENTFNDFLRLSYFAYGLYFDNTLHIDIIRNTSTDAGFFLQTADTSTIIVINTLLSVFKPFCLLILGILLVVCVAHIIAYGINSVKNNLYEVGVLKALGAKSFDIGKIFVLQIIMVGFLICITSIVGMYLTTTLANSLLLSSFEEFIGINIFNIDIITYIPKVVSIDLIILLVLSIVSSVIPLIYLHNIKPLNILKGNKK